MVPPSTPSPLLMPPPPSVKVLLALAMMKPWTVMYPAEVMFKMLPVQSGFSTGVMHVASVVPPLPSRIGRVVRPGNGWMTSGTREVVRLRRTLQLPT